MPPVFKKRSYLHFMRDRRANAADCNTDKTDCSSSASSSTNSHSHSHSNNNLLYSDGSTVQSNFCNFNSQLPVSCAASVGISSVSSASSDVLTSMYQSGATHHHTNAGTNAGVSVNRQLSHAAVASTSSPASSNSSVFDATIGGVTMMHAPSGAHPVLSLASATEYKPFVTNHSDKFATSAANSATGLSPGALCAICDDKATGKHYGAQSCDGCKGFFRRSVRKNQQYRCRFQRACQIDKDKRNQCRFCRLSKCFRFGMRKEAVQNERDKIGSKNHPGGDEFSGPPNSAHNSFSLQVLVNAEMMSRRVCYELANGGANTSNGARSPATEEKEFVATAVQCKRIAAAADIVDAMHRQLLVLVEWSKAIPCFMTELNLEDQIAMLRAHAGDHLLVGVTKRSLALDDTLLLANGAVIPRNTSTESEIYRIANRVIDELVRPMQELKIDDNECACLKAIVFFDPSARGLSNSSRIRAWRHQVMLTLDDYVRERSYDASMSVSTPAGRFGELMMLIPVLQNLSMLMVEQLQLVKLVGAAKLDSLLQEILLGMSSSGESSSANDTPSCLTPPPSVATQSVVAQHAVSLGAGALGMRNSPTGRGAMPTPQSHLHGHATTGGLSQFSAAANSHQSTNGPASSQEPSKGSHERMT